MNRPSPLAAMKPRQPVSRDHVMFTALLIVLALIGAILWLKDSTHRYSGESRVGWPAPAPAKP